MSGEKNDILANGAVFNKPTVAEQAEAYMAQKSQEAATAAKEQRKTTEKTLATNKDDSNVASFFSPDLDLGVPLDELPEGEDVFRGVEPLDRQLNSLPVETRKQLHNLRAGATKKEQAAAARVAAAEQALKARDSQIAELERKFNALASEVQRSVKTAEDRLVGKQELNPRDVLSAGSQEEQDAKLAEYFEQLAAKKLKDIYQPAQDLIRDDQHIAQQAAAASKTAAFMTQHAEFQQADFRQDVEALLQPIFQRFGVVNPEDVETAYYAVRGKRGMSASSYHQSVASKNDSYDEEARDENRRQALHSVSKPSTRVAIEDLDRSAVAQMSAAEYMEYSQKYKTKYGKSPPRVGRDLPF